MDRYVRTFGSDVAMLAAARTFARDVLEVWGLPPDEVLIVVGELAANAILHAEGDFEVSLRRHAWLVVAEVADRSPAVPLAKSPDADGVGGRGLEIIEKLARSWGFHSDASGGKVIWAEIPVASESGGLSWGR